MKSRSYTGCHHIIDDTANGLAPELERTRSEHRFSQVPADDQGA